MGHPVMCRLTKIIQILTASAIVSLGCFGARAQEAAVRFKVIAFYTGRDDLAHISFVKEANRWFPQAAVKYHFSYEATTNWADLNAEKLAHYQVVLFLDTRPEAPAQRAAFEHYMEHGGAWMGFHFCAFALTPSGYPQIECSEVRPVPGISIKPRRGCRMWESKCSATTRTFRTST